MLWDARDAGDRTWASRTPGKSFSTRCPVAPTPQQPTPWFQGACNPERAWGCRSARGLGGWRQLSRAVGTSRIRPRRWQGQVRGLSCQPSLGALQTTPKRRARGAECEARLLGGAHGRISWGTLGVVAGGGSEPVRGCCCAVWIGGRVAPVVPRPTGIFLSHFSPAGSDCEPACLLGLAELKIF